MSIFNSWRMKKSIAKIHNEYGQRYNQLHLATGKTAADMAAGLYGSDVDRFRAALLQMKQMYLEMEVIAKIIFPDPGAVTQIQAQRMLVEHNLGRIEGMLFGVAISQTGAQP